MKKLFSAFVVGSLFVLPFSASAETLRTKTEDIYRTAAVVFPDVPALHQNFISVGFLNEEGVIKGYPDGTFKPDAAVNRAELTKMVVAKFENPDPTVYKDCFPDVKNEWFAPYICLAKSKGWVSGYPDGTFKPGNSVNRVEAIKIVLNVMIADMMWPSPTEAEKQLPLPADSDASAWYAGHLKFAIAKELLDGQHVYEDANGYYYKPADSMTRKEVAEMMYRTNMYMTERFEYASIISEAACFFIAHPELADEELKTAWSAELLEPVGYTLEDADALTLKYQEDDVMNALIQDSTKHDCGDSTGVDMSKWEVEILRYAR